jgi:hypothetical protein
MKRVCGHCREFQRRFAELEDLVHESKVDEIMSAHILRKKVVEDYIIHLDYCAVFHRGRPAWMKPLSGVAVPARPFNAA